MKKEMPILEQVANVLAVAKRLSGKYVVQCKRNEQDGWQKALSVNPYMSDGGLQPPGPPLYGTPIYGTLADAQESVARRKKNWPNMEYRPVEAGEDIMEHTALYTHGEEVTLYGEYPTIGNLLKRFPLLEHGDRTDDSHEVEHWVEALQDDEPVDIALDCNRDGISEDCFGTTAGELKAAGYGQLSFEQNASGVTVFADTKERFLAIQRAVE